MTGLHSPLGASSAERWMNCVGSTALVKKLQRQDDAKEGPEYRKLGTAAHEVAALCLLEGRDAWEAMGQKFNRARYACDSDMANAVQVYLDIIRGDLAMRPGATFVVEHRVTHPAHPLFFGTLDCGIVDLPRKTLVINDYKHGEGVGVEIEENPQLMYYAYGFMKDYPEIEKVILRVVQPRFAGDALKEWTTTAQFIRTWAEDELIPAMLAAELDGQPLTAGDWCRFCPAKLICPLMVSLFGAAATSDPKKIVELNDTELGRSYALIPAVKSYCKELETETLTRNMNGRTVGGTKLVYQKANRVFKEGAEDIFRQKFGDGAFTKPALKSPAQMEELGADAAALVKEYAYSPTGNLTVALLSDRRPAVKPQTSQEVFGAAVTAMKGV